MSGVSAKTRALVVERDEERCVRCGKHCYPHNYSLQHRRARGMGGDRRPDTNAPQNLIVLCGHATGTNFGGPNGDSGCHAKTEARYSAGWEHGWWIRQMEDPLDVPVTTWRGRVWLDAEGGWRHVTDDGRGEVINPVTGVAETRPF